MKADGLECDPSGAQRTCVNTQCAGQERKAEAWMSPNPQISLGTKSAARLRSGESVYRPSE